MESLECRPAAKAKEVMVTVDGASGCGSESEGSNSDDESPRKKARQLEGIN